MVSLLPGDLDDGAVRAQPPAPPGDDVEGAVHMPPLGDYLVLAAVVVAVGAVLVLLVLGAVDLVHYSVKYW